MARQALLVGSEIHGLAGVHNDVRRVGAMLAGYGFQTTTLTSGAASRAGILASLEDLIETSGRADAVVF